MVTRERSRHLARLSSAHSPPARPASGCSPCPLGGLSDLPAQRRIVLRDPPALPGARRADRPDEHRLRSRGGHRARGRAAGGPVRRHAHAAPGLSAHRRAVPDHRFHLPPAGVHLGLLDVAGRGAAAGRRGRCDHRHCDERPRHARRAPLPPLDHEQLPRLVVPWRGRRRPARRRSRTARRAAVGPGSCRTTPVRNCSPPDPPQPPQARFPPIPRRAASGSPE